jgi:phosphohistidine phosphatase SixA
MRFRILIFLFAICFIGNAIANDADKTHTLYLVRHAEKQQDGSRDPELTAAGKKRSQQLANWFRDKDIKDIWSSDYKRTRDTANPLLSQLGLEQSIYDPGDQAALVKQLLEKQHNALIIGHSNTIPELARLLCDCVISDMDESEYDRLIIITAAKSKTRVKTLQQNQLFQP